MTKQKTNLKETQNTTALLFLLSHGDLQSVGRGLLSEIEYGKENSCKGLRDQYAFQVTADDPSDRTRAASHVLVLQFFNQQINVLL